MLASRGTGRYAPKLLQAAILKFYTDNKLFPNGVCSEMNAIQVWSLKMARALCRLVACNKLTSYFHLKILFLTQLAH